MPKNSFQITQDLKDFSSICDADFAPKTSMAGLPSIIPSMPLKENKAKVTPNYIKKAMEKRGIDPESIKEVRSKETKNDKNVEIGKKAGKGDNKDEPSTSRQGLLYRWTEHSILPMTTEGVILNSNNQSL